MQVCVCLYKNKVKFEKIRYTPMIRYVKATEVLVYLLIYSKYVYGIK